MCRVVAGKRVAVTPQPRVMLCGEFLSRIGASPASTVSLLQPVFGTRSPYFTLLTICQGMAALTANPEDEDIYLGKCNIDKITSQGDQ